MNNFENNLYDINMNDNASSIKYNINEECLNFSVKNHIHSGLKDNKEYLLDYNTISNNFNLNNSDKKSIFNIEDFKFDRCTLFNKIKKLKNKIEHYSKFMNLDNSILISLFYELIKSFNLINHYILLLVNNNITSKDYNNNINDNLDCNKITIFNNTENNNSTKIINISYNNKVIDQIIFDLSRLIEYKQNVLNLIS